MAAMNALRRMYIPDAGEDLAYTGNPFSMRNFANSSTAQLGQNGVTLLQNLNKQFMQQAVAMGLDPNSQQAADYVAQQIHAYGVEHGIQDQGLLGIKELAGVPAPLLVLGAGLGAAALGGGLAGGAAGAADVAGGTSAAAGGSAIADFATPAAAGGTAGAVAPSVAGSVLSDFAAPASVDAINLATPGTISMGVPAAEIEGSALVPAAAGAGAAGAAAGTAAGSAAGTGAATAGAAGAAGGAAASTAANAATDAGMFDLGKAISSVGLGGIVNAGANLIGAGISSNAAKDAAQIQADATKSGIAEQQRQFDLTRSDLAPYRAAGTTALTNLGAGVGSDGTNGPMTRKFTLDDFWQDPVVKASYDAGLKLGTTALKNAAPLTYGADSGAGLKALTQFGTDYTGNMAAGSQARFVSDQSNQFNKEAALAGVGQAATTTGVNAGQNTASNVSNLISGQGNAGAAARIGQANAYGGALGNIANWWQGQQTVNQMQNFQQQQQQRLLSGISNWATPAQGQPDFSAGYY